MNYILISPLKHISVATIAITFWNHKDIRNSMEYFLSSLKNSASHVIFLNSESNVDWLKVEDNVRKKVDQLPLPGLLKEKVLNAIKPVGNLILKWMACYFDAFFDIDLPKEFCWTSRGILDETETAKLLIKDKTINITRRYKISCIYCLEDNIKELWNELPEDSKKSISNDIINPFNHFVNFWTDFINGCDFNSGYLLMCQYACQSGNRVAAEFFFKKLCPSSRNTVLHSLASQIRCSSKYTDDSFYTFPYDITLSLLTHANKEQQLEFFQMCPFAVLVCLLDWPWQSFFAKTVNYLRTFLSEKEFDHFFYYSLLKKVTFKIMQGYKDYMYENLFEEFWQLSSDECKAFFFTSDKIASFLSKLCEKKDTNKIKMILHNPTSSINLLRLKRNICKDMIENEEWDLLKFFIQECFSSKIEVLKFKAIMKKYMAQIYAEDTFQRKIDKWNNFFSLTEEITMNPVKGNL